MSPCLQTDYVINSGKQDQYVASLHAQISLTSILPLLDHKFRYHNVKLHVRYVRWILKLHVYAMICATCGLERVGHACKNSHLPHCFVPFSQE